MNDDIIRDYTTLKCKINGVKTFIKQSEYYVDSLKFVPDEVDYIELQCGNIKECRSDKQSTNLYYGFSPIVNYGIGTYELIDYYAQNGYIVYRNGYLDLTPFVTLGKAEFGFDDGKLSYATIDLPAQFSHSDCNLINEYLRRKGVRE